MDEVRVPLEALKGRGAASWLAHRFERDTRQFFDDGWDTLDEGLAQPREPLRTEVIWEEARSIISSNESPDVYFDRSINPYRGCEHGCFYCYARPTHSYLNMSPGLDFETKIVAKRNIAQVLRAEMARKNYEPRLIAIGTATDCYQPVERELRLTRSVIELMHETRHAFSLVTKSSGVERNLDLIASMAARGLASVTVTGSVSGRRSPPAAGAHAGPGRSGPHRRWPFWRGQMCPSGSRQR